MTAITWRAAIAEARLRLEGFIPEPTSLDAQWLLEHVTASPPNSSRHDPRRQLSRDESKRYFELVERRRQQVPLAHLLGSWEFFGYEFDITPNVLIPRPDTELLVDLALDRLRRADKPRLLEPCTGSGCIAMTIALEHEGLHAIAADCSRAALTVAARNCARHALSSRIELVEWNLTDATPNSRVTSGGPYDAIIVNPPYIAPDDPLLEADVARYEPRLALIDDLDRDGIGFHRIIARNLPALLRAGGFLLVEHGEEQASAVRSLFAEAGLTRVASYRDLAGRDRATMGERE